MATVTTWAPVPLSAAEIERACAIVKESDAVPDGVRFVWAAVAEGAKDEQANGRRAEVLAYDRPTGTAHRLDVDLDRAEIVRHVTRDDVQPSIIYEEYALAGEIVRADPDWQAAMRKRGITDFARVQVDPWATGNFRVPWEEGRRVVRAMSLWRDTPDDNGYAHPIENVTAFVDLNERRVIRLEDHGVVPVPTDPGRYDAASNRPWREPLKPLEIVQAEGPSFTLDGNAISWDCWRLAATMHPVDGIVLHDVAWVDNGTVRPIMKRASLAEMIVPYGDVAPDHGFKHVMDVGEYGFGNFANSLELGCDCLGEIRYLDAHYALPDGEALSKKHVICIHEEDAGILWKHWDHFSGASEVRRSRRLVVSSIHTVGNYEYGIFWYLYLDGSIQLEMKLTGILNTSAIAEGAEITHGRRIARQLAAPHHQHLFCMRLDLDIDGTDNTVVQIDSEPEPLGPDNPFHSAFVARETPLRRESEAAVDANTATARYWEIRSASKRNGLGEPTGYRLKLGHGTTRMLAPAGTPVADRGAFAQHNLWVTAYHPDERKAAGDYPNQHLGGDGLPEFIKQDRELEGRDVVVWATFGTTHIARPEDWPVMPCEYVGMLLQPCGFFDRNPAMNLPPTHGHHC
jgi:primary-amine oxidase